MVDCVLGDVQFSVWRKPSACRRILSDQTGRMSGNGQQQSDALAVPNPGTNQTRTRHLHADGMAAQCSATASRMLMGDSSGLHHGGFNSNQIPPPDDKATLAMLPPSHFHSLGMQFSSQASAVGLTSSTGAHTGSSQQQIPDNAPRIRIVVLVWGKPAFGVQHSMETCFREQDLLGFNTLWLTKHVSGSKTYWGRD